MTMLGIKHSKKTKEKIRKALKRSWKNPYIKKKITESNIKTWQDEALKIKHRNSLIQSWQDKDRRKKASKQRKKLWKNPDYRAKMMGRNHYNYKGGKIKNYRGYIYILKRNHPFCNQRGYVREHRFIIEQQIGRYLRPKEVAHHINNIKDDNRPENLMAFINESAHDRFEHNKKVRPEEIIFDGRKLIYLHR